MRHITIGLWIALMGILWSVGEGQAGQTSPEVGVHVRAEKAKRPARVDVNTAGIEEISRVPGMTAQTAERIIGNRPYRNLDELVTKKAVGRKEFAQIREYITIRTGKK
jgi:DNA uptake protein ComE-like DNA-binding protein